MVLIGHIRIVSVTNVLRLCLVFRCQQLYDIAKNIKKWIADIAML